VGSIMIDWLIATLRSDPELLILISLTWGFAASQVAGFRLGKVTVTLLAAVVIGKLGMIVSGNIKSTFLLLLLLFAAGYGVGSLKLLIEARTRETRSASRDGR
jgi:putative transport protein